MVDDDMVSCVDLQDWALEFESLAERVPLLIAHPNSQAHARDYLAGLLAPIERKNGWTIAEYVGQKEPKAMQRFLNQAAWDADATEDYSRRLEIDTFGRGE